jgi:Ca-activated chloride channel family protein
VYGHRVPNDDKANGCQDTELIVPVGPLDPPAVHGAIDSFPAKGFTPIGLSLQQGAADLPAEGERTIVLVSDGVDTCAPPDPCVVARDLAAGGVNVRIETVGFQVDAAARDQLRCIAEATGGAYRDAPDAGALADELRTLSQRALRTYQAAGLPIEGGAAPAAAEPAEPGQYIDDIAVGEQRWYSIEAEPGQRIEATATFVGDPAGRDSPVAFVKLELQRPGGRFHDGDQAGRFGRTARSVAVASGEIDDGEGGEWLVVAEIADQNGALPSTHRYPLELVFDVSGTPRTTTTTADDPRTTEGTDEAAAVEDDRVRGDGGGGGWSPIGLAVLALACGAAGWAAGALSARRWPRSTGPAR